MTAEINYPEASPGAARAMAALQQYVRNSGLEAPLLELVKIRASQINGCAYCIDMHTKDARAGGETEQRIYLLERVAGGAVLHAARARGAGLDGGAHGNRRRGRVPRAAGERPARVHRPGAGGSDDGHGRHQRLEPALHRFCRGARQLISAPTSTTPSPGTCRWPAGRTDRRNPRETTWSPCRSAEPSRPWLQTRNSVEPGPVLPAEHHVGPELLEVEPARIAGHGRIGVGLVAISRTPAPAAAPPRARRCRSPWRRTATRRPEATCSA